MDDYKQQIEQLTQQVQQLLAENAAAGAQASSQHQRGNAHGDKRPDASSEWDHDRIDLSDVSPRLDTCINKCIDMMCLVAPFGARWLFMMDISCLGKVL